MTLIKKANSKPQQVLVSTKETKLLYKTTGARKGCCYFCGKKWKEQKHNANHCANCTKEKGQLYVPAVYDRCRMCNAQVRILTGEQPQHTKQGFCTLRCAGEWTQGTSDTIPYNEMMLYR